MGDLDEARGRYLGQRPGDQPLPVHNGNPEIHVLVAGDIMERQQLGISRYGTPLQAHNGRDALRDAYEEALDLACYLRQLIEEGEAMPAVQRSSGETQR